MGRSLGYPDNALGQSGLDLIHQSERADVAAGLASVLDGSETDVRSRRRLLRSDGSYLVCELTVVNRLEDPHVGGVVLSLTDMSEQLAAEAQLRREHQLNQTILDLASSIIVTATMDGHIVTFNRAAEIMTGCREEEVVGRHYERFVPPEERADVAEVIDLLRTGAFPNEHENHWMTNTGARRLIHWTNTAVLDDGGRPSLIVAAGTDITDARQENEQLAREARHDTLTGLCNRAGLIDDLDATLTDARRSASPVSVLFVDLDGFKAVNDQYGHAAGDTVLKVVAERLQAAVRPEDTVARIGGDEFVLVCSGLSAADAAATSGRIKDVVSLPIWTRTGEPVVSASIGLTMGPDQRSGNEMLAHADADMYQAKRARHHAAAHGHVAPPAPEHPDEPGRLEAVAALAQVGPNDRFLQDLVAEAAALCEAPMAEGGAPVGTLCVLDRRPRLLPPSTLDRLDGSRIGRRRTSARERPPPERGTPPARFPLHSRTPPAQNPGAPPMNVLYTAVATATGDGRNGHATSEDGQLDLDLRIPEEMGGPGGATNPEQLFAVGYAACFHSALKVVGGQDELDVDGTEVSASVGIGVLDGGGFGLTVELDVHAPELDDEVARKLVERAHEVCPYSNATRGNVEITLQVV